MNHSQWLTYEDREQWRSYPKKSLSTFDDVYFLPEYSYLYANNDSQPYCFVHTHNENIFFYPFLKSRIPQRPGYFDISSAYGYGGPISNTSDQTFNHEAYRRFCDEAKNQNIIAELIRFHPIFNNQTLMMGHSQLKLIDTCPTVHVDINIDEEDRWSKIYTHANRKNINKAKRNGVQIVFGKDEVTWAAFKALYAETMSANQATSFYYFSDEYYQRTKNELKDNYILASAVLDGQIVSVLILLLGPTIAHCHRIGTKRDFMPMGVNNLLHHETIQWCKRNNLKKLLIGGGRGNTEDDKLYQFKKNFSDLSGRFFIGESILDEEVYTDLCKQWALENPDKVLSDRLLKYRY